VEGHRSGYEFEVDILAKAHCVVGLVVLELQSAPWEAVSRDFFAAQEVEPSKGKPQTTFAVRAL
jgi:hypothetical protein